MGQRQVLLPRFWCPFAKMMARRNLVLMLLACCSDASVCAQRGMRATAALSPSPPASAETSSACTVILTASGLPATRKDTECDSFTNVLNQLVGQDGYNTAFCALHASQVIVMNVNMGKPTAQGLIKAFDPRTQNILVMGQMLQQMSAGFGSWVQVHILSCFDAPMFSITAPKLGLAAPVPSGWKPTQTTNETVQLDFMNTAALDCPLTCTIQAELTNISTAGLTALTTCNAYALQVTNALGLEAQMQCIPGWSRTRGLVTQVEVDPEQSRSLLSSIISNSSQLILIADRFNYDCLQPSLILRSIPSTNMTGKTCSSVSNITVPGTNCTDKCKAPLPLPFTYVGSPENGVPLQSRFSVQCLHVGGTSYRQLMALSLVVMSFGDEVIDVNKTLTTSDTSACCVGSPAMNTTSRRLQQTSSVMIGKRHCTSPVSLSLTDGYQLSADNLVTFSGDTRNAWFEFDNSQVPISIQNVTEPTLIRDIIGSSNLSRDPAQVTLFSDGSTCGSGAAVYAPGNSPTHSQTDRVRLQWVDTLPNPSPAPTPSATLPDVVNTSTDISDISPTSFSPSSPSGPGTSHMAVIVGSALGGTCALLLLVGVVAWCWWGKQSAKKWNAPYNKWKVMGIDSYGGVSQLSSTERSSSSPNASKVSVGLDPEEPFMSYAHHFHWTGYKASANTGRVEAGINDTQLDRLAQDGTCPVVELTRADVSQQLEVLTSGLIGRGGAALVFICRWPSRFGPDALLAMKVLRKQYDASPYLLQTFASEAKLLAALRHPNVLTLYGYCLELPTVCLMMELMPGSLEDLLYKSPKSPGHKVSFEGSGTVSTSTSAAIDLQESDPQHAAVTDNQHLSMLQALQICADIASGLAYLHNRQVDATLPSTPAHTELQQNLGSAYSKSSKGLPFHTPQLSQETGFSAKVAHRDLKPANVLISSQGRAKLSDFGLAREHESSTVHTMHMGAGTLAYMAPELLDGRAGPVMLRPTNRVDIYSFAVLMWELLAGQKPWQGLSAVQLIGKVGSGQRPDMPSTASHSADLHIHADLNMLPASFHVVPELVGLIKDCWQQRDLRRPAAADVHERLLTLLQKHAIGRASKHCAHTDAV